MKTAISLPDPLFKEAEKMARRMGLSRSQLYARAIESYVKVKRGEEITEALNRVYGNDPPGLDPVLAKMQWIVLARDPW